MSTDVGSIIGYLKLDSSDWMRETAQADAAIDKLDGKDAHVKVKVDGAAKAVSELGSVGVATQKLGDANSRLAITQARLNEIRSRGVAKQSQILSAERSVAVALRGVEAATRGLADASEQAAASEDEVDFATRRVAKSASDGDRKMRGLTAALIAVGPAIVPLAAGAVGLGVAFGGMGAAGILAVVGIRKEMESGSLMGLTYKASLDQAKTSVMGMAKVAAGNVLGPLQQAVADLQDRTPKLTAIVGDFSTMAGTTAANLTTGLLNAFISLEPLMRDAGAYVQNLSARFSDAMSGGGIVAFGDYVRSVFPQVMTSIESIVAGAGHLVAAFAPLGMGTLTTLGLLSDLISAIPVEALSGVAEMATAVFIGFKTWQGITGLVGGLTTALGHLGTSATTTATAVRGLQIAAGIIGVALAGLSFVMSAVAEKNRQAEESANRYADALRASNGVIDESIRQSTAKALADQGVLEAGRKLGINLADITNAALGNADAMARVNSVLEQNSATQRTSTTVNGMVIQNNNKMADAADLVRGAVSGENEALQAGVQKSKDLEAATRKVTSETSNLAIAAQTVADRYGTTPATFQAVTEAQKRTADAAKAATLQMQLENNAAGLLKQSLDDLGGKSLSAAQAQNSFDSALANMGDHVSKTGKKITFTTTSINDMSSASVALRGQLLGQITSAQQTAEAYGQVSGSAEIGRKKLIQMREQIIKNAVAHGVDKKAVTEFVDSLMKIPKDIPPTKLDVEKAEAEKKAKQLKAAADAAVAVRKPVKLVTDTAMGIARAVGLSKQIQDTLKKRAATPLLTDVRAGIRDSRSLDSEIRDTMRQRAASRLAVSTGAGLSATRGLRAEILDTMRNRSASLYVNVTSNVRAAVAGIRSAVAGIGAIVAGGHADGGTVVGPGGPREDRVLTFLSPGEEVIKNGPAQRHRGLLKAINAGRFADGGTVGNAARLAGGGTVAQPRFTPTSAAVRSETSYPSAASSAPTQQARAGLSDVDIERLARAFARVQIKANISPGAFDRAVGAML